MIERQHGQMEIACDTCGEGTGQQFTDDDFTRMVSEAKQDGWKISPDGEGGWTHHCPGCKSDRLAAQKRLLGF